MKRFLELRCQRPVRFKRLEHVAMALTPRGIGDFCHHILQLFSRGVIAVVNGDWVVLVAKVSPVGQKINRPDVVFPSFVFNALANRVSQWQLRCAQKISS